MLTGPEECLFEILYEMVFYVLSPAAVDPAVLGIGPDAYRVAILKVFSLFCRYNESRNKIPTVPLLKWHHDPV